MYNILAIKLWCLSEEEKKEMSAKSLQFSYIVS